MKYWIIVPMVVFAVGCSGGSKEAPGLESGNLQPKIKPTSNVPPKTDDGGPPEVEKFADSVFKIPSYPGAERIKYSSIEMTSSAAHSYNRHYKTMDSVDKVAEFYMAEGVKVGKLADTAMSNKPGSLMRVVLVELSSGEKLQMDAMNIPKGNYTDISLHLISRAKK
jgi:hypothetical protein